MASSASDRMQLDSDTMKGNLESYLLEIKGWTVSQGRFFVHCLIAAIKDESRGRLIKDSFRHPQSFNQRLDTLQSLFKPKPKSIQATNEAERTVISFLKNMSIEYKAGTLVIYIEFFLRPGYDAIWQKYIQNFKYDLWSCNFVEFGHLVFLAKVIRLVYNESDLLIDYKHICSKKGQYEWDFWKIMIDGEGVVDGNLQSKTYGYALIIDIRQFYGDTYKRSDGGNSLNGVKNCFLKAGFKLFQNEETKKTKWERETLEKTLKDFRNFCAEYQPREIALILMSCAAFRDGVVTSDLEEVNFAGDIQQLFYNDCEEGKLLKYIQKRLFFYQDITVNVSQLDTSSNSRQTFCVRLFSYLCSCKFSLRPEPADQEGDQDEYLGTSQVNVSSNPRQKDRSPEPSVSRNVFGTPTAPRIPSTVPLPSKSAERQDELDNNFNICLPEVDSSSNVDQENCSLEPSLSQNALETYPSSLSPSVSTLSPKSSEEEVDLVSNLNICPPEDSGDVSCTSRELPVNNLEVQIVSERCNQSKEYKFCSSLFQHCFEFVYRQLYSTHLVHEIVEIAYKIVHDGLHKLPGESYKLQLKKT